MNRTKQTFSLAKNCYQRNAINMLIQSKDTARQ